MYVYESVYVCEYRCPVRPKKGIRVHGARVTGGCEPPDLDAGNEPGSSERARGVLNHKPSLQPCVFMFPVDVWCAQDIYVHSWIWPSQYPHWGVVWLTLVFRWQWWGQCELTSCAAKTHGFQGQGSADAVLHRFCEVLQVIHYTRLEWWQYINTRRESPSQ